LNFIDYPYGEVSNNGSKQTIKAIILGRKTPFPQHVERGEVSDIFL